MENPMIARIRERLEAVGKNEFEVAIAAGFDRIYLYEFLEGRKKSLRWNNIPRIASVLDCDPRYLTGEIDTPWPSEEGQVSAPQPVQQGLGLVQVSGMIAKNAWFQDEFILPARISVAADQRHPVSAQRAFIVSGDSWRDLGIMDGSVVVTAQMPARDGDLVVAKILRENGEAQTVIARQSGGDIQVGDEQQGGYEIQPLGVIVMETRTF